MNNTNETNSVISRRCKRWGNAFPASYRQWITVLLCVFLWAKTSAHANLVDITLNDPGSRVQGGVYVGPYNMSVNNILIPLVCDDFIDHVSSGESWQANVYTFNDLSQTKWTGDGLQKYGQDAWLYEQGLLQPAAWGDISYAMWAVFNPTPVTSSAGWTSGASNWLAKAEQRTYTANEFSGISIYTPTQLSGNDAPQEFIGGTPVASPPGGGLPGVAAVPEPGIGALFGLGLVGLAVMRWYNTKRGNTVVSAMDKSLETNYQTSQN